MVCIYCGSKTQIINSRPQKRLNRTWRRHKCLQCQAVFTTEESVHYEGSIVVRQPQGALLPFSRDKLFASVLRAVGHRVSPIEDAGALTATITARLVHQNTSGALTPSDIILATQDTLRHFDSAAAVQYQAYHKG